MDGLGGRGATWCHKAQLEWAWSRECPASKSHQSVGQHLFRPEELKLQDQDIGHAPRHARTRPQGPEAG